MFHLKGYTTVDIWFRIYFPGGVPVFLMSYSNILRLGEGSLLSVFIPYSQIYSASMKSYQYRNFNNSENI